MRDERETDTESKYVPQMSVGEIAQHFKEPTPVEKRVELPTTPEEADAFEKAQDNSNDIYKISARVKNLARGGGGSLTPVGDILCNSFTHVLKSLYDFAERTSNEELEKLIRSHEGMPADVIAAAGKGVRRK